MLTSKRILFVHSSAELYGSDRCLLEVVKGLVAAGGEAHVVLPGDGKLVPELRQAGASVHFLDPVVFRREILSPAGAVGLCLRLPVQVFRLARLIRKTDIDLVHTNTGVTLGGAMAAKLCRVPHVWHFREILSEFNTFLRLYQPLLVFCSDRFIFITEAVKNQFSSTRITGRGEVVYDGIPTEQFNGIPWEAADGRLVITTVGRLAPYKGQEVFIEALSEAHREGVDFEAFVVGDVYGDRHAFREKLVARALELGLGERIHFVGFQDQVQPFLERCNLFVMPATRQEALGIVMLEAMAAGRAVIATRGGGAPEIIKTGENGVLVTPGSVTELADAIVRLARDPEQRKRLVNRGRQVVEERFSEKAMVDSVLKTYAEMLGIGKSPVSDAVRSRKSGAGKVANL